VRIEGMTTKGDQIVDRPLAAVGGKGLFIKELEVALLDGRCDLAVHSLKDVPMNLEAEFVLAAILERGDPRDALVAPNYAELSALPPGSVVGTSSLRRAAQIRARYPQLRIESLRGNLDTRLDRLDSGAYDAIVVAAIGLTRLGLGGRIRMMLPTELCLPAPGQGALGIEVCSARPELRHWLAALNHRESATCVSAERAVSRGLGGNCSVPLAAYATVQDGPILALRALVANESGTRLVHSSARGPLADPEGLGVRVAAALLAQGALDLITAA
jgi:hydroxymethylbilane synthase